MKMLFHANEISETGTSTSMIEYANWFQRRGNEVEIAYNSSLETNHRGTIRIFEDKFEVHPYTNFNNFAINSQRKYDFAYFIKAGSYDGKLIPGVTNAVHAVFQNFEPHGDSYAYVSAWIANMMSRDQQKWLPKSMRRKFHNPLFRLADVPHFVSLPPQQNNLREEWKVPNEALVVLRYGGYEKFDIKWVQNSVLKLVAQFPNLYFVFINTRPFALHKRIIYLPITVDKQFKSDALHSADIFLHARSQGECFSMALLEAMNSGIFILSWSGGVDRGHTRMLDSNSLYDSPESLESKMKKLSSLDRKRYLHSNLWKYSEDRVMDKFVNVFLKGKL